jgi:hypothetical protein
VDVDAEEVHIMRNSITCTLQEILLSPWSRYLLEKLIVIHLVKKLDTHYGTKSSFTCSQNPATGTSPEPDEFNTYRHTVFDAFIAVLPSKRSPENNLHYLTFSVCNVKLMFSVIFLTVMKLL